MDNITEFSMLVNLDRLTDYEKKCYASADRNPVILWLEEHVGPSVNPQLWPQSGKDWKCWMVFNPLRDFSLTYCEVNFTCNVDDSIISLFILRWT